MRQLPKSLPRWISILYLVNILQVFPLTSDVIRDEIHDEGLSGCGVRKLDQHTDRSIIGGTEAVAGSWPWMVSVQYEDPWTGSFYHVCGGSLIDPHWVLTAAHCVDSSLNTMIPSLKTTVNSFQVMLGGYDLYQLSGMEQFLTLECIIQHPDWLPNPLLGYPNDIALLKLSSPADTSRPNIGQICLPTVQGESYLDQSCWITGWGLTEPGGDEAPSTLHQAKAEVLTNVQCSDEMPYQIRLTHVCVGGEGQAISCDGDSGGPLSCQETDTSGDWEVAGVSSWGFNDCIGFPSVYTRVSMYLSWMKETIATHKC